MVDDDVLTIEWSKLLFYSLTTEGPDNLLMKAGMFLHDKQEGIELSNKLLEIVQLGNNIVTVVFEHDQRARATVKRVTVHQQPDRIPLIQVWLHYLGNVPRGA